MGVRSSGWVVHMVGFFGVGVLYTASLAYGPYLCSYGGQHEAKVNILSRDVSLATIMNIILPRIIRDSFKTCLRSY